MWKEVFTPGKIKKSAILRIRVQQVISIKGGKKRGLFLVEKAVCVKAESEKMLVNEES